MSGVRARGGAKLLELHVDGGVLLLAVLEAAERAVGAWSSDLNQNTRVRAV